MKYCVNTVSIINVNFCFILITAPYGIFARSCVAMAKDSKSTFQIIDDEGYNIFYSIETDPSKRDLTERCNFRCPVDPSIFPSFTPDGNALQSVYEAFRFTESYGVIFQCNVKYCLGPCEPVIKTLLTSPRAREERHIFVIPCVPKLSKEGTGQKSLTAFRVAR